MLCFVIFVFVVVLLGCILYAHRSIEIAAEMSEKARNLEACCLGLRTELTAAKEELDFLRAEKANRLSTMYNPEFRRAVEQYIRENSTFTSAEISKEMGVSASTIRRWRREMKK